MAAFKNDLGVQGVEEIFHQINQRQTAALMFHIQMADYFRFLGFHGYATVHSYQYLCEAKENLCLREYYIEAHGEVLPDTFSGEVKVIPNSWSGVSRVSIGKSAKQKAVEEGIAQYYDWEKETKTVYETYAKALRGSGNEADAIFVDRLIEDVSCELKEVEHQVLDLISTGYDMIFIVENQSSLCKKYKKKGDSVCR